MQDTLEPEPFLLRGSNWGQNGERKDGIGVDAISEVMCYSS